jgi:tetratricopeptide (TPR) repeat protein
MKFKYIALPLFFCGVFQFGFAQSNSDLLSHYKAYYAQMQKHGDVQGIINAMTHLLVLEPNEARQDTLAALYMNEGKYIQALNILGIQKEDTDSDMAVEVKAVSLKSLNEPARALEHYEVLFQRNPSVGLAYELADLKIQIDDIIGANTNITYGIANSTDEMMKPYYETQTPYQVPIKAGFLYLKAIAKFRENPETSHEAVIAILEQSLSIAPNFNLATIAKNAIVSQKEGLNKD